MITFELITHLILFEYLKVCIIVLTGVLTNCMAYTHGFIKESKF